MPMYDFFCAQCDKSFEELILGDEVPTCPQCGTVDVQREISAPSPLKTGAFPFKAGPVHPIANKMASAGCPKSGGCGGGGFS